MRRYLSLYLPTWSTDIAGRHRKTPHPLVLVAKRAQQITVIRACERARERGIEGGMSLSFAKAIDSELLIRPFTPAADARDLMKLVSWCYRHIAPVIGVDPELLSAMGHPEDLMTLAPQFYGVTADLTGTERLHRDERLLAKKIFSSLHKVQVRGTIACAPTIGAAWALSRYGNSPFITVPPEGITDSLSPLPVDALRLPPEIVASLHTVGIYTVSDLIKIPSSQLSLRYGTLPHLRLDQARGILSETLTAIRPESPSLISRAFDPPLHTTDAIHDAAYRILSALLQKLTKEGKEGGTYTLTTEEVLPSGSRFTKTKKFTLHAPSTNLRHLSSLVTHIIDSLSLLGEVTRISLGAPHTSPAKPRQCGLTGGTHASESIDTLLNEFIVHLGSDSVKKAQYESSYIPERSFSYQPMKHTGRTSLPIAAVRPPILFTPPESAQAIAMLPDRPPSWINWKGSPHRIVRGIGPERIGEEWWHHALTDTPPHRDYFKVLDDIGRWLWIYRDSQTQRWFVHGVWG